MNKKLYSVKNCFSARYPVWFFFWSLCNEVNKKNLGEYVFKQRNLKKFFILWPYLLFKTFVNTVKINQTNLHMFVLSCKCRIFYRASVFMGTHGTSWIKNLLRHVLEMITILKYLVHIVRTVVLSTWTINGYSCYV